MGESVGLNLDQLPLYLFQAVPSFKMEPFSFDFIPSYRLPYCPGITYKEEEPVFSIAHYAHLESPPAFLKCTHISLLGKGKPRHGGLSLVHFQYLTHEGGDPLLDVLVQEEPERVYVEFPKDDRMCVRMVSPSFPDMPELSVDQTSFYELTKRIIYGQNHKYVGVLGQL